MNAGLLNNNSISALIEEKSFEWQSQLYKQQLYNYEIGQLQEAVIALENLGLEYAKYARDFFNQVKLYGSKIRFNEYQKIYPRNYNDYPLLTAIHAATALFKTKAASTPETINPETTQRLADFSKSLEFVQASQKKSENWGTGMLVTAGLLAATAIALALVVSLVLLVPPAGLFMGIVLVGSACAYGVIASGFFDRSRNLSNLINKMQPLTESNSPAVRSYR